MRRNNCGTFVYVLIIVTLYFLSSCQWLPEVESVRLSESAVTMQVGSARQLSATVEPAAAEYDGIGWSSNNPSVVSVSNGTLVAHNVGSASITATAAGVTSSPCEVTVRFIPVNYVTLDKTSLSIIEGESTALVATISPSNATDKSLSWSSSNPSVARVDAYGTVIAVSPGTATITVRAHSNVYATCQVTVKSRTISVTGVSLNRSSLTINKGETSQLTATVSPSNATNKDVTWTSNNPDVASVASDGTITANKVGSATITVKTADGGKTATCSITVKSVPVTSVTLSPSSLSMTEGETSWLTATVSPSNASNKDVTWSSNNTSVATVSSDGEVTAKKAGTATITAKTADGGKTATCSVTVKASTVSVTGVSLNTSSLTLQVGKTASLVATVSPSNATNKGVIWTVGNTSVASVTSSGLVTANKVGTTVVTVKTSDGGKTATCTVTVKSSTVSVTGVAISPTSLSLTAGDTYDLTPTVSPSNATNKAVTWSSSNTSVATVSSDGTVTAKSAGSATITCTTSDGGKTATCSVTVKAGTVSVTGVSLNRTSMSLTAGTTGTLTATVSPSNATNKAVTWSSNNTTVATVSSSGVVTAKAAGSATITVRTDDGGKTATCTVTVTSATVAVTGVSVSPTSLSLTAGETYRLTPTVSPSNATNTGVTWTSSNTSVATVGSDGTVTAKAAGSATITCTTEDGAKKATCSVTVKNATVSVSSVSLDRTSMGLVVGSTGTLKATINPSNATNQGVTWSSNNTSVATVSSGGVVTAKAAGSATITVRTDDGGKTATCTVTVSNATVAVTGVSVSPTSLSLTAGETYRLTPTVSPSNATNASVSWTSSNTSVATVGSDGTVTAKVAGSVTITCTTQDGNKTASCSVTVTDPSPTLSFQPQVFINGMKGFKANSYVYQPLDPSAAEKLDSKNESWVVRRDSYSESNAVLTYNVSPSSFRFDNSYDYYSAWLDVSTRIHQSEDFGIQLYFNSYEDGLLRVEADIVGKEAYDGHMTTFALKVSKNGVTYTSDYAAVSTIRWQPFISGLPNSISSVWTNEIDQSSSNITVDYTSTVDLKTKTVVKMVDDSGNALTMGTNELESAGLSLEYEVVKNYMVGSPVEDQGNFVTLSGSVLYPRYSGSVPNGGRTPIVRVKLMHNGDVIDVAYHKVYISFPSSVSVTGVSLDKTSLSLEEGNTATLTATVSPSNATNKAVTWSSSNTSVATVSTSGVVTAKSAGSATITCTTEDGSKKATCAVTVTGATTGTENGHAWVDLGLPSGIKWATCNVGASRPEDYGKYYAWGEVTTKDNYDWDSYKWGKSESTITKYKNAYDTLSSTDDVARNNWKGGWRIPRDNDFQELLDYCTWEWSDINNIKGYLITSKANGKSIFLPACGGIFGTTVNIGSGSYVHGSYWTSVSYSSAEPFRAYGFMFGYYLIIGQYEFYKPALTAYYKTNGLTVRPVLD